MIKKITFIILFLIIFCIALFVIIKNKEASQTEFLTQLIQVIKTDHPTELCPVSMMSGKRMSREECENYVAESNKGLQRVLDNFFPLGTSFQAAKKELTESGFTAYINSERRQASFKYSFRRSYSLFIVWKVRININYDEEGKIIFSNIRAAQIGL